ncbi:MAG TPA: outer membrane protein assembly factor BamD [Gemmatimonadaceae bacterium]|jgi:outer membrane protein assembly factor BamD|nr:outer membrane protein assembly factor BamD [Gemmatimonadaceae bacterium]
MFKTKSLLLALLLAAPLACKPPFNPKTYPSADKLYQAALAEYKARRYDNAAKAFEQLTLDLSARDPRLPLAYYYLAQSQSRNGEYLLAAGTYNRLIDAFPQDSLVDDAFYLSGLAYEREWRQPQLDATYGKNAQTAFESLVGSFPDSQYAPLAKKELDKLDEWFARKDYDTGYLYLKRKAFDSAIIYFKDVIRLHPNAKTTREAYLRLHEAYRAIRYVEDARELCDVMRKTYPNDREVSKTCGPAPVTPATPAT